MLVSLYPEEALQEVGLWTKQQHVRSFRAADLDPSARFVLRQHGASGPEHVQGDILARVSERTAAKLQGIVKTMIAGFQRERQKLLLGRCRGKLSELKKRWGQKVLDQSHKVLKASKFKRQAHCYKCGKLCPVHPGPELRKKVGDTYVIIGGSTCVSWSSMGLSLGWLHQSAPPFLVWVHDFMAAEPTHVIHECTRAFDATSFSKMVASKYHLEQMLFSPEDVGLPVHRSRSYCLLTLKSKVIMSIPFSRAAASELVFQKVIATAKMYFRSPERLVTQYCAENAKACRADEADSAPRRCLSDGQLSRLEEHLQFAQLEGRRFACINYAQNLSHMKFDERVPAITTSATIWGASFPKGHGSKGVVLKAVQLATTTPGTEICLHRHTNQKATPALSSCRKPQL